MGARFVVGLASAGYPAVAQAAITRAVPPAARGRMIAGFVMAVVAGSFVGQAIVGGVAELTSAAAALAVVCVIAPLVVASLLWRSMPAAAAPRPPGARPAETCPGCWRASGRCWRWPS